MPHVESQVRAVPANPNDSLSTADISWIGIDRMQSAAGHWSAGMILIDHDGSMGTGLKNRPAGHNWYTYKYVYIYIFVCVSIYIHTYTHTHIYIYICVCVCILIYLHHRAPNLYSIPSMFYGVLWDSVHHGANRVWRLLIGTTQWWVPFKIRKFNWLTSTLDE